MRLSCRLNVGANNRDEINGMLFEIGEVSVFKGTDGLHFNLLKITKNVKFGVTPRTKIKENFLLESNTLEDGSVIFAEDPLWRGATMTFAHILRDESIVTVNLAELNMLGGTFYKMDKETFLELVCVSQDFENSLEKENTVVDELVEGVSSGYESDDGNEEQVELADNPLDYRERRARKGRGNGYNDTLFNLKYS